MQTLVYSVSLFFYKIGIHLASPFNEKARMFLRGRKDTWRQVSNLDPRPRIWLHCASLGEFEQGRPVIEELRRRHPDHCIVLTFFSPSGFNVRKEYPGADHVLYLPLDSAKNARKWIKEVRPVMALIVKYEFWHHFIREMHRHKIPVLSISSIFREDQVYFKSYGSFYRKILKRIDHFFVQDAVSRDLLHQIGIESVTVSGDTRFDRVAEIRNHRKEIPEAVRFIGDSQVMVAGSVWPEDMDVLIPFVNNHSLKFIVAPHEIQESFMARIERDIEKSCVRFSKWDPETGPDADVLIIDNIGMLSSLYAYAHYSWVGGAYGKGLHNILEAAVYGCPVFFGDRNYEKFREARDLINLGGAAAVSNYMDLKEQFNTFSQDKTYTIARQINTEYIQSNRGATKKIMQHSDSLL